MKSVESGVMITALAAGVVILGYHYLVLHPEAPQPSQPAAARADTVACDDTQTAAAP
jgi:hypothetical protein